MRLANAVYERARSTLHAGWCDDEDERRIKVADNNKKLDGRFFVCLSLSLSLSLRALCDPSHVRRLAWLCVFIILRAAPKSI